MEQVNTQEIAGEVLNRLSQHPETLDQDYWLRDANRTHYNMLTHGERILSLPVHEWECGTTACLAGHIVSAAYEKYPELDSLLYNYSETTHIASAAEQIFDMRNSRIFHHSRTREEVIEWLRYIVANDSTADQATLAVLYDGDEDALYYNE